MAGQRKGKEDERHLWPEMLRAIREIKPKYIVGENVFGLLNWNGGMVFDEVHSDLEFEGYEVQAVVIPAAAVNAPHGRDRVWFVAHNHNHGLYGTKDGQSVGQRNERDTEGSNQTRESSRCANKDAIFTTNTQFKSKGSDGGTNDETEGNIRRGNEGDVFGTFCSDGDVADTKDIRRKDALENGELEGGRFRFGNKPPTWDSFPSQSPICGGDDGLPTELDGITFSKWRNESIKAYGNAIVPQVAYQIFKAIQETI
jgi:DNA (cytosine-5)-methyltransferase 1